MQKQSDKPNIVLIMADDMGFSDLGCYGGEIRTPNIDGLARRGIRFTHCYNNAKCSPTRASLLTGLYPQQIWQGRENHLERGRNNVTVAEVLKLAGYRTLLSGKWHNGKVAGELPVDRGFDRAWGLMAGCSNYFNPGEKRPGEPAPIHKFPDDRRPWADDDRLMFPFTPDEKFYATDAFTEHALEFLDLYGQEDNPFFLYLPYTAPHYPMQAWPEDIARYQGSYLIGWDELRRRRHRRMVDMGLVDERWSISERDGVCPVWEDVEDKDRWDRKMAVYAAMIDRMDHGIGRVLAKVRELNKEQDTLVIFLSDNGGCSEHIDNTPDLPPGGVSTYTTVDAPWANASNTPFRKYKTFDHEGGISTPLIVSWPRVIKGMNRISHDVCHVVDFLPTFAELSGVAHPSTFNGRAVLPWEGKSLLPIFHGGEREGHQVLFWELRECRAVRKGKWKLVTLGPNAQDARKGENLDAEGWELYDMEADRCEQNDLSGTYPQMAEELKRLWHLWRDRCRKNSES